MGQIPPKFFLPSSPYGASPASNVLNPSQPVALNPQQPLLPPNFQDPGTMPTAPALSLNSSSGGGSNPFSGGGGMNRLFGRGLFGMLVLFMLASTISATTTVTGNLKNLSTVSPTSGVFVRFWLRGCQGTQPRVNGVALIAPSNGAVFYQDFVADGNGNISGTVYSTRNSAGTGNGEIECPSSVFTATWYGVQLFTAGSGGPETPVAAKNGATLNVTNVTPLSANPVVIAPTGDTVYLRLDGGNSPITGNVAFNGQFTASVPCAVGQILYVEPGGCYATIDAAVAAVPSFSIVAATGCSESSFTVTCTTTATHTLSVNQEVYISGVGALGYNGFWTTIAGTTGTTVKYTNTVSGLGTSGGGTVAAASNIIIPSSYLGAEAATCSSLDNAGHDNGAAQGYTMALTPPNIHIEDRRATSACNYDVAYNSGQIGARPSNIAVSRVDTSPNLTSSNIVGLIQYTGTLPSAQSLASITGEDDLIGNVTLPAGIFVQVINGQWAIRSVGGTVSQVMGVAGGGGIDRTFDTTNIIQASGLYAFDPKNVAVTGTAFSITNATESGSTATITTSATCNFTTGQGVKVSGVTNNSYNGSWTVLAPGCNGGSTFTYTQTTFGLAASSSGTAQAYAATIQESYGLVAAQPQTGIRNNDTAFFQGPVAFADNLGGIDVMNQNYVLPTGATAQPLLRFGGDNNQITAGVNQYSTAFGGVPYKFLVVAGNQTNWMIGSALNASNSFEITPSTAAGGTTFSTPGLRVFNNGAGGSSTVAIDSGGLIPRVAGTGDIGAAATPFGNLWLGTAATNNFKFQPAATAAARVISIPDPLGNTTLPLTIASGAQALNTASITTATCDTGVAATATGTLSTDRVDWSFNAAPTATNKYGAFLVVYAVPSANVVTFYTCNPSATTSTPTAMTVNWSVRRP